MNVTRRTVLAKTTEDTSDADKVRPLRAFSLHALSCVAIADASRATALLRTLVVLPVRVRASRLVTAQQDLEFPGNLQTQFDLLEPNLLFGIQDLRFHRISAGLEPLPAPRPLAPGAALGEYHVVGRR